mgnify:FL=1
MTTHTMKKRTIYIAAGSIILLPLAGIISKHIIENRIEQALVREVDQRTAGLYHLQVERTTLGLIKRSVTLEKICLIADTTRLISQGESHFISQINIAQLTATKIDWQKNASDLMLSCDQFTLRDPIIHIFRNGKVTKMPDNQNTNPIHEINPNGIRSETEHTNNTTTSSQQLINKNPRSNSQTSTPSQIGLSRQTFTPANERVKIGNLILTNGAIYEYETDGEKSNLHVTNGISFETGAIAIDLTSDTANTHLSRRNLTANIVGIQYTFQNKENQLRLDTLYLNTTKRFIRTTGLQLIPQLPQSDYAELSQNHSDWTKIQTSTSIWTGIDFTAFMKERSIVIDTITIQHAEISSYKNRQIAQSQREKQLLNQTLRHLPIALDIRCLQFGPLDVVYQELTPERVQPGKLTVTNLTGECLGLSNRPAHNQSFMTIRSTGKLMELANIQTTINFSLQDTSEQFTVNGQLGSLAMDQLNTLTEPLANLSIQNGRIDSMIFNITGNKHSSAVDLKLLYNDLEIELIKDHDGQIRQRRLLSEAINDWVVHSSNPQYGTTRIGTGTALRDPYKSQFNYLWKSLWPGLKSTLIKHRDRDKTHRQER